MVDSLRAQDIDLGEIRENTIDMASEDSLQALTDAQQEFRVGVLESLKNQIAPYLLSISNEVSSWGIEWTDVVTGFLTIKGIKDLVGGIKNFFPSILSKFGISLGSAGSTATTTMTTAGTSTAGAGASTVGAGTSTAGAGASTVGAGASTVGTVALGGAIVTGFTALGRKLDDKMVNIFGTDAQKEAKKAGVYDQVHDEQGVFKSMFNALSFRGILWDKDYEERKDQKYLDAVDALNQDTMTEAVKNGVIEASKKDASLSKSQYDTYNSHRTGLDYVPADNYKATLHAGEMVLTAKEANEYRKMSEYDSNVFKRYDETSKVLQSNAQNTLTIRNKLATQENLQALKDSAPAMLQRFSSLSQPATDSTSSSDSNITNSVNASGPVDEQLMLSGTSGFFQALGPSAKEGERQYKVFAATTLAQAALESGWGKSNVAKKDKNLFGIKWTGKYAPGLTVTQGSNCPSKEQGGARPYNRYISYGDSMTDHAWFLANNSRYSKAGCFTATNAKDQIKAIAKAGYAEDPNYANSLIKMVDKYNLTQYEQGTPFVPSTQVALLHEGEMVVPKQYNPFNGGKTLDSENTLIPPKNDIHSDATETDLSELLQLLKWGFDFLGKKLSEEKIVQAPSTNKKSLRSLHDPYQDYKLGW